MPLELASAMQLHTMRLCRPEEMRVAPKISIQLSPGVETETCHVFFNFCSLKQEDGLKEQIFITTQEMLLKISGNCCERPVFRTLLTS